MPSERIQRRIDAFLDEADGAATARRWDEVLERARAVLGIGPENDDALAFISMADSALGGAAANDEPASSAPPTSRPPDDAAPSSFAGGRYVVQRFLGEGGKKRVYLAHDGLLDRDVAFALIKTEGLDEIGRERVVREAQAMGHLGCTHTSSPSSISVTTKARPTSSPS
jgi:hypothetical protein